METIDSSALFQLSELLACDPNRDMLLKGYSHFVLNQLGYLPLVAEMLAAPHYPARRVLLYTL